MAELKDVADQFAKDLMAQNIAGLMLVFTPEGMNKAMNLQTELQAQGPRKPATSYEVNIGPVDGEDTTVDLVMKGEDGELTIETRWREVEGSWKVNDLGLKT